MRLYIYIYTNTFTDYNNNNVKKTSCGFYGYVQARLKEFLSQTNIYHNIYIMFVFIVYSPIREFRTNKNILVDIRGREHRFIYIYI